MRKNNNLSLMAHPRPDHLDVRENKDLSLFALSWQRDDALAALTSVGVYVEREITRQIEWYYAKKRSKSVLSRGLRLLSIFLAAAGGLAPLAHSVVPAPFNEWVDLGQAGYILFALAAACVAADRFFGISTAWMRYVTAALALELIREKHRMEWTRQLAKLGGRSPAAHEIDVLFRTAEETMLHTREYVQNETMAWVEEFQSSLSQLERRLNGHPARTGKAA